MKTAMTAGTANMRPLRTMLPPLTATGGVGTVGGGVPAAGGGYTGWVGTAGGAWGGGTAE